MGKKKIRVEIESVKKRINGGESVSAIAQERDVSQSSIYYLLKKDGFLPLRSERNSISREILKQLYVDKRLNLSEIQKILPFSIKKINNALVRYGFKEKKPDRRNKKKLSIERNVLVELYVHQNKRLHEIARYFNCCQATIARYVKKYGIKKYARATRETVQILQTEDRERQSVLRVVLLVNLAKAVKYPSVTELAEKFKVDKRTIQQDISFARKSLKVSLKYSSEKKGYFVEEHYSFDEVFEILTFRGR